MIYMLYEEFDRKVWKSEKVGYNYEKKNTNSQVVPGDQRRTAEAG
jgi:hypothetical protein